jgi:3-dehydroquinate dehydratase-2
MILLVNGPNLNLLGEREPRIYGHETLADVERRVAEACAAYGLTVKAFQSNWEGAILDFLQEHRKVAQGVILNAGALTHTSRALHDCLKALPCPTVEVHISNIHAREEWRRESLIAPAALGQISGLGTAGYYYAALHLCARAVEKTEPVAGGEPPQRDAAAAERVSAAPAPQRPAAPPSTAQRAPTTRAGEEVSYAYGKEGQDALSSEENDEIPVDVNARGDYEP